MIFDDGKPIGMARLLGDYAMAYLIKDVAVPSEYHIGELAPYLCYDGIRQMF